MTEYLKPLPFADAETKPYWDWAKRHELRMQRCADCGAIRLPARPDVPGVQLDARRVGEDARHRHDLQLDVVHPPVLPAFAADAPYAVVLVQLDDDPPLRLVGQVIDIPNDELAAGIPVEVVFDDVTAEVTLPKWRRRKA